MGELLVMALRLLLQVRNLWMKHDSLGYPTTLGARLSEKSPSTASATGRFGLGVASAFVDELLVAHTRLDQMLIESSAGREYRRLACIIASLDRPTMQRQESAQEPFLHIVRH